MRACTSILPPFRQVSAWKMEEGGREQRTMPLDSAIGNGCVERSKAVGWLNLFALFTVVTPRAALVGILFGDDLLL